MKSLLISFFIVFLLIAGCKKNDNIVNNDKSDEYRTEPKISKIFPMVAIPNGYIYVIGENFGSTNSKISVKFKSRANQVEKNGIIETVEPTKITVKVPNDIDTSSAGNEIIVTTPKGTVKDTTTVVYGVKTSAFGNNILPGKGLIGFVYQLSNNTPNLPDFNTLPIKSIILAPNLDVPVRAFTDGFPGVPGGLVEWFGIRFIAKLVIETEGVYNFAIGSDDGSKLYIDNKLIIDNDGLHGYREKSNSINLSKGEHSIRIDYFQGPKYEIALRLFWQKPGGSLVIIPPEAFNLPDISQINN